LLALFDGLVFANLVCNCACTCACRATDQRALSSSGESAYDGPSRGGSTDNFRSGVFAMILFRLFPFSAIVGSLGGLLRASVCEGSRDTHDRTQYSNSDDTVQVHLYPPEAFAVPEPLDARTSSFLPRESLIRTKINFDNLEKSWLRGTKKLSENFVRNPA
jgi:hypothetical protein